MKNRNGKVASRLQRQFNESETMKDLVASIVRTSPDPANELAEELLFAGSATHFDALCDANVSVTSYCRVMEKQVRTSGKSPYNSIMHNITEITKQKNAAVVRAAASAKASAARAKAAADKASGETQFRRLMEMGRTKAKRDSPKERKKAGSVCLSSHTMLTERRRKLMMLAMMDTMAPEEAGGESREEARDKLDHFIAFKCPENLAHTNADEEWLLDSEDPSRNPSIVELEEQAVRDNLSRERQAQEEAEEAAEEEAARELRRRSIEDDSEPESCSSDSDSSDDEETIKRRMNKKKAKEEPVSVQPDGLLIESNLIGDTWVDTVRPNPQELLSPKEQQMIASSRLMSPPKQPSRSQSPLRASVENANPWNPVRFQDVLRDGRPLSPEAHVPSGPVHEFDFPSNDLDGPRLSSELPSLLSDEEDRVATAKHLRETRMRRANSQKYRKPKQAPRKPMFLPNHGDYDVMRNRWNFIWPQTRQLKHPTDQHVPSSADKVVTLPRGHIALKGSIFEATKFINKVGDNQSHYHSITSRTDSLITPSRHTPMGSMMSGGSVASERSFILGSSGILRNASQTTR
jgi:hypothetical protein